MKRIFLSTLFVLFSALLVFGQKTFENKQFGFSIEEPKDWIQVTNQQLLENTKKYERTDEELAKLLESRNGAVLLGAFYKYDPKTRAGLIPSIQIYAKAYTPANFQEFKRQIIESSKTLKTFYADFEFIQEPSEIEISGIRSMYFLGKYTWKSKNGADLKARTRSYMIPYRNYFFQLGFNDGQTEEDNAELFEKLVKTIKIGNL